MNKKITAFLVSACLLITATSCSKAPKETAEETPEKTTEAEAESQVTEKVYVPETENESSESELQMRHIADAYAFLKKDFFSGMSEYPESYFAITDLNHNERLEIIISFCLVPGSYSNTFVYEVSEDYSSLEKLPVNGQNPPDEAADFLMFTDKNNPVLEYDCYKKDGEYYYLMEDAFSQGLSYIFTMYYAYSFGDGVKKDFIGGYELIAEDEGKVIKTRLRGPNVIFGNDEAYLDHMNSFWSDYEKQDACQVKWMPFSDDIDFYESIEESYSAFNPNIPNSIDVNYDYHVIFDSVFGEDYVYEIQDS